MNTVTTQRYQLIKELQSELKSQKRTIVAQDTITDKRVVIKEFRFQDQETMKYIARRYHPRIAQLEALNHPLLPKYFHTFKTSQSLCLVREYIPGESLGQKMDVDPVWIKKIALNILDILIFLQKKKPALFHLNLKPENILITPNQNIVLTDFQFFHKSGNGASSGFVAPEQRQAEVTRATDLYSLGAILICLLTKTPSHNAHRLINQDGYFVFRDRLNQLNPEFLAWLEKMVQPKASDRFSSAIKAKIVLSSLSITKISEVYLRHPGLKFNAHKLGEKVSQTLHLRRLLPKSLQEGKWEIATHPSDPPYTATKHPWISINPSQFHRSHKKCKITIDTSRLIPNQTYERLLVLHQYVPQECKFLIAITVNTATQVETKPNVLDQWLKNLLIVSRRNKGKKKYNPSDHEIRLSLSRFGNPTWTEEDFQQLIQVLGEAGYGWLSAEGIRQKLEQMKDDFDPSDWEIDQWK